MGNVLFIQPRGRRQISSERCKETHICEVSENWEVIASGDLSLKGPVKANKSNEMT